MKSQKKQTRPTRNMQDRLNEVKDALAKEILAQHSVAAIRARGLSNLDRWKAQGTWCSAHDEWRQILTAYSDEEVVAVMTDKHEFFVRLRQSPPYPGMLGEETRLRIWDEVMSKNLYDPLEP